ncbi:MAG: methionine aminopeptidase [Rhodoglobus sp.]
MTQWWYNHKTGKVEEGPQSLGSDRDGPYETEADAKRAPEIAQERSRKWAEEEAGSDGWGDDD